MLSLRKRSFCRLSDAGSILVMSIWVLVTLTILGVGIGGGTPCGVARECEEAGIRPEERAAILRKSVEEVRALWEGSHPRVKLSVRPLQAKVPLWIAAGIYLPSEEDVSAQAGVSSHRRGRYLRGNLDRVACLADGWFTIMATPEELRRSVELVREKARLHERDPESIVCCQEFWIRIGPDSDRCFEELRSMITEYFDGAPVPDETIRRWSIWGTPEECRERITEFVEAGLEHAKFVIAAVDPIPQAELLVSKVVGR